MPERCKQNWLGSDPGMACEVYVSAPPASSMTVTAGQRAQDKVPGERHAKSCLTPEPLRTLRPETKGQAAACPDRTQAIPCKLQGRLLPMACDGLTATVTAAASGSDRRQRITLARSAPTEGYVRPEKRTVH